MSFGALGLGICSKIRKNPGIFFRFMPECYIGMPIDTEYFRRDTMRKLFCLPLLAAAAISSAAINFEFDNSEAFVTAPESGSITYTFTGTVTVDPGFTVSGASLINPYMANSTTGLTAMFANDLLNWILNPTSTYTGALLTVMIDSTSPAGEYGYALNSTSPSTLTISATDGVNTYGDSEAYVVNVEAVPEPATMAVLGLGAAALVRRRRAK